MKSWLIANGSAALAALALIAGCSQQNGSAQPSEAPSAAAPEAKPGIAVGGATLLLPVVAGRPGAAYFSVSNGSPKAASLAAVHIAGAGRTEMHETKGGKMEPISQVDLAPGATVEFKRGGKHVMAFDLSPDLKPGSAGEITLVFADGDKVSAPLSIRTMADAMQGMAH